MDLAMGGMELQLGIENISERLFIQAFLGSFLSNICYNSSLLLLTTIVNEVKSSSCQGTLSGYSFCFGDSRLGKNNVSERSSSNMDEEDNASEKAGVNIIKEIPAPDIADTVSKYPYSEWLLMAKKDEDDDEDEDEDEEGDEEDESDDDDDEGGEEGDEDEGGEVEGEVEGDDNEEEDDDDDDEEDEDEDDDDDEDDDEYEDDDEDETPPKKSRK